MTKVLGSEHPRTLLSMHNLAHTCAGQDRLREAISMIQTVIRLRTSAISADHPHTRLSAKFLDDWSKPIGEDFVIFPLFSPNPEDID
jgi:hypothetical protein